MPGNPPLDPEKVDKFYEGYKRPEKDKKKKGSMLSDILGKLRLKSFKERTEDMKKEADKLKD